MTMSDRRLGGPDLSGESDLSTDGTDHLDPAPTDDRPAPPADRSGRWAAASGAVATAAGLAVAALVAGFIAPSAMPITAIGDSLIAIFPAPVINFGKDVLGYADKPVLLVGITVVAVLLGALAGALEHRRRNLGWTVIGPIAGICFGCAVAGGGGNPALALIPTAAAVVTTVSLLRWLLGRLTAATAVPGTPDRRRFLHRLGLTGLGAGVVVVADRGLAAAGASGPAAPAAAPLPVAPTPAPIPAGADLGVPDLTPYLTPVEDFYRIDTALVVPRLSTTDWRLRITGMVDREIEIDYATLTARPLVEHVATLTCVSNEVGGDLVGNARWLGVLIRDVLAEAGPQSGADMVLSTSSDGFTAGTPLEVLTDPDRQCLFAFGMNGQPLPFEHGYPVRMVVPGLYGYVSATKWVTELKVTTFAADQGYWTPLGWSALGPIKLASRIDVPGRTVPVGPVVVAGVAWAQHTGIRAVQVQIDGGEWRDAQLAEVTGPDTWRQWRYDWSDAAPGDHTLRCRAQDADGTWQTEVRAAPAPNGASGFDTTTVRVG